MTGTKTTSTKINLARFQRALQQVAEALDQSYDLLVATLSAGSSNGEDAVEPQQPNVAGECGPMNLYLVFNKSVVLPGINVNIVA